MKIEQIKAKRRPIYFPALSCAIVSYLALPDNELYDENIVMCPRFYSPTDPVRGSYLHHPYVLFSAAHYYKKDDLRKDLSISDDTTVFIDSGGFQKATEVVPKTFDEATSLKFIESCGDIAPILDTPVATKSITFGNALEASKKAGRYFVEHRSKKDLIGLNVMSAMNQGQMETWYNEMKDLPLDGWCHGSHNRKIKTILKGLLFLINKGEYQRDKPTVHHAFGVSSPLHMLYLSVAQNEANKLDRCDVQVTYDASTPSRTAAFGNLMSNYTLDKIQSVVLSNRFDYDNIFLNNPDTIRGISPVFDNITDLKKMLDDPKQTYTLMALNNLYVSLKYKSFVDSLVFMNQNDVLFSLCRPQVRQNILAIQHAFRNPDKGIGLLDAEFHDKEFTTSDKSSLDVLFGDAE